MKPPFVSVIIPSFNHGQYLRQRIETVLGQTYHNFEIILIDDCSTDNSREVIERLRDHPRFTHIIYNETNSGSAFKQWAKGIALSKGEYIWIAESDDWCEPSFLENIISGMLSVDNCVVGYCQSFYVEGENTILWQTTHKRLNDFASGKDFISDHMLSSTAIYNASMAVWKKDVFDKISKSFLDYRFCGDWLFWIELCQHGNVFISGKLLSYFRKHEKNISREASKNGESLIEELKMFEWLYQNGNISYADYFKSLRSEYLQFKGIELTLSARKVKQIKDSFSVKDGTKSRLINFYRGYYTRTVITKLFNKIFTWSFKKDTR